jgi:hypothetical protein
VGWVLVQAQVLQEEGLVLVQVQVLQEEGQVVVEKRKMRGQDHNTSDIKGKPDNGNKSEDTGNQCH